MAENTNTEREALLELIDAYAEARHVGGCHTYNAKTAEARAEVIAALDAAASPYVPCYVCGRPMDGLSEDDCHCFHRKELRASLSLPAAGQEPVAYVDERAIAWLANARAQNASITTTLGKTKSFERPMALCAAPQPAVAAGWVMVPLEPTEAMWEAFDQYNGDKYTGHSTWLTAWSAMLKAAPLPPAPSTGGESNG